MRTAPTVALAVILIVAGCSKLRDLRRFELALEGYGLRTGRMRTLFAPLIAAAEVGVGVGVVVNPIRTESLMAAVALFAIFAIGELRVLVRHTATPCGCMQLGVESAPVTRLSLARTAGCLALAIAGLAAMPGRFDIRGAAVGTALAAVLIMSVYAESALAKPQSQGTLSQRSL